MESKSRPNNFADQQHECCDQASTMTKVAGATLAGYAGSAIVTALANTGPVGLGQLVASGVVSLAITIPIVLWTVIQPHCHKYKNLWNTANTDPLTGCHNRLFVQSFLGGEYERAKRFNRPLSVLVCDLDHFKKINDTYGHDQGDNVLRVVASTLRAQIRAYDVLGRIGGEEFLVVLPETSLTSALLVAERCRLAIEKLYFPAIGSGVTMSIGVAAKNAQVKDINALFKIADESLYAAKNHGRNQVTTNQTIYDFEPRKAA